MYPKVSIFNCVSTAYEMLRFSSDSLIDNAGYNDYDYIIVTWGPTEEVSNYLKELSNKYSFVHIVPYQTNKDIPYVPNLRAMMNTGFTFGFELNNYCGLVNTDMYFGKNWLINLVKYANENSIVNSTFLGPVNHPSYINVNLGIPEYNKFDLEKFNTLYDRLYADKIETEEERGGHKATTTMPYLLPKGFWESSGPWELRLENSSESPDVRFFDRCKKNGAHFVMSRSSIVYHHEAVERRGNKRPAGAENMREE